MFRDVRGGVAVVFALALPAIAMLVCGAIDIAALNADRSAMQDTADATALAMAKQLGLVTSAGLSAQAANYATAQLGAVATRDSVSTSVSVSSDGGAITVSLNGSRGSFFGNLLPPGGWKLATQATAVRMNEAPLCVLIFGDQANNNIHLQDQSVMQAPACLVHSNENVQVDPHAALDADDTEASGTANGTISPAANVGAPQIADPFAQIDITFPSGCSVAAPGPGPGGPPGPGAATTLVIDGSQLTGPYALAPGLYCQNIDIKNGASVQLSAGEYYLAGNLTVEDTSSITGTDVAIQFNTNASFNFMGASTVSLSGRTSGKYAGFVILTTRDNQANFTIESNHVTNLLGTIYVPNAQLQVYGTSQVAQASAWTVITALSLVVQAEPPSPPIPPSPGSGPPSPPQPPAPGGLSSPLLVINANYSSSNVPVPVGVGSRSSGAHLVK
jgi:hypothetical protein